MININELRDYRRKYSGQIGIAALAIGMVPMVLIMLLAGQQLNGAELEASLTAKLDSDQKGFQAQVILYQILESNSTRRHIIEYPYADNDDFDLNQSEKRDKIEETVNEVLEGKVEEYDFKIRYPNHENLNISNSQVIMGVQDRGSFTLPSPEGTIFVDLNIEGTVSRPLTEQERREKSNNNQGGRAA